jgi:hypothetical protein
LGIVTSMLQQCVTYTIRSPAEPMTDEHATTPANRQHVND